MTRNRSSFRFILLLFLIMLVPASLSQSTDIAMRSFFHQQNVYAVNENITASSQSSPIPITTTGQLNNNSKILEQRVNSYFIFPSQKALFGQAIINATKESDTAMLSGKWTIQQSRAAANALLSLLKKEEQPKMKSITDYQIPTSDGKGKMMLLRLYDPGVKQRPSPVLIFVHGGGWSVGNVNTYDDSIKHLANSSGLIVAAMDYRLAPEYPFPTGLNDVVSTIRWIANNGQKIGIDANNMGLGGDSAGANLALSAALTLRDSNNGNLRNSNDTITIKDHNLIRVLYLLYGPYSPTLLNSTSMKMFGNGKFGLTYASMRYVMSKTFQNASDYKNPLAFPLLAKNLTGLPPMYIAAMSLDPLKDDSIMLANRLQEQGQEYYFTIWPGVTHGALSLIPVTPQIQNYVDAMTTYLRGVLTHG
jgi:acetyl esterase